MIDASAAVPSHACTGDSTSFWAGYGSVGCEYYSEDNEAFDNDDKQKHGHCMHDKDVDSELPASRVCQECKDCGPCHLNACGTNAVCEVLKGKSSCSCPQDMPGDPHKHCGCSKTSDCKDGRHYCHDQKCIESTKPCGWHNDKQNEFSGNGASVCTKCEEHDANKWADELEKKSFTYQGHDVNHLCNFKCDSNDNNCGICELDNNGKKCVVKGCKADHVCCKEVNQSQPQCTKDGMSKKKWDEKCQAYADAKKNISC